MPASVSAATSSLPRWAAFNASSHIKEPTDGNIRVAHGCSNDMFQAQQDARHAGRHPEKALRFIGFMPEGRNSVELSNRIGFGNPDRAVMRYIEPEIADNRAVFPDAPTMPSLEMMRDLDRGSRRVVNRLWTEIKPR